MAEHEADTVKTPFLSTTAYDTIKFLAQYVFPALGVLYFALAGFWGFPEPLKVIGTITAIDTFLGVVLGFSKASFQAVGGDGQVDPETGLVALKRTALAKDTIVITNPNKGVSQ